MESFDEILWSSSKVKRANKKFSSNEKTFFHIFRTCLTTTISLNTRNDELLPAHGVLLSASHTASSNLVGQISHLVRFRICQNPCKYCQLVVTQLVCVMKTTKLVDFSFILQEVLVVGMNCKTDLMSFKLLLSHDNNPTELLNQVSKCSPVTN